MEIPVQLFVLGARSTIRSLIVFVSRTVLMIGALACAGPLHAAVVEAVQIIASGDPMPGTTTGETFRDFTSFGFSGGTTAFIGVGRPPGGAMDTRRGVYSASFPPLVGPPPPPAVIVDSTTPVPGSANPFARFDVVSTAAGRIAFTGGLPPGSLYGVYTNVSGALARVADTSQNAPGRTEKFFFFRSPSLAAGKVAFTGNSRDGSALPFDPSTAFEGVYTDVGAAVAPVAQKGTAIPGAGAARFNRFSSVWLDAGRVVFEGGNDSSNFPAPATVVRGVYTDRSATLARVADRTTPIPPGNTENFDRFVGPQLSLGSISFIGMKASLAPGVYTDFPGALTRVVDSTTPLPDDPTKTFNTVRVISFSRGNLAILGGPDAINVRIYVSNGGGAPARVVGPGDTVLGKLVSSVFLAPESLSGNQLLFLAFFADGTRGLFVTTIANLPVRVNVCINFAGSGITTAAGRTAFVGQVQAYYDGAGIGTTGNRERVIFFDATATPAERCDINGTFMDLLTVWGRANKRTHTYFASPATANAQLPGAAMAARRLQALAETSAHEAGHTLCAVHDCRNGGGAKATVAVPGGMPCPGAAGTATIMTVGTCVANPSRGNAPGTPGARAFSMDSVNQIKSGVNMLVAKAPNWALVAAFDTGILRLVQGKSSAGPLQFGGQTLIEEDGLVNFSYKILSGDTATFEFGWLNETNEFIEPLPVEVNADQLLENEGGAFLHFALRGLPSTPFAGQVFSQKNFGTLTFSGKLNSPGDAATPGVVSPYFSQVQIDFNVAGNPFSVLLDTGDWGSDNGFYRVTNQDCAPEVSSLVQVNRLGFRLNLATGHYVQDVNIRNSSSTPISTPISLVLDNLSNNAMLFNKTGDTNCASPSGSPFINLDLGGAGVLNPGETATVTLEFATSSASGITYVTRVLGGQGAR